VWHSGTSSRSAAGEPSDDGDITIKQNFGLLHNEPLNDLQMTIDDSFEGARIYSIGHSKADD
jgi:hypothetical protein